MFKFKLRRGTAAQWAAANPVLFEGEPGLVEDTRVFKVGDGVSTWNSLPVFLPTYLQQSELNVYIAEAVENSSPITPEDLDEIADQVLQDLELPDLVLLWENAKA